MVNRTAIVNHCVTWLKRKGFDWKVSPTQEVMMISSLAEALPPFQQLTAALLLRAQNWRLLFLVATGLLGTVVILQQRIIFHKLFQKSTEEVLIVPGSPEFFRVRPGQIPDESVFLFAEFVAEHLGTFSYRNARYHFAKISEHMQPMVKSQFEVGLAERLSDWEDRKVDQSFSYEPVKSFDLVTDDRGPKYVISVRGTRTQYVEGHVFAEKQDVLALEFRTRANLTPEKPFIFEIAKLEWLTPAQYEATRKRIRP